MCFCTYPGSLLIETKCSSAAGTCGGVEQRSPQFKTNSMQAMQRKSFSVIFLLSFNEETLSSSDKMPGVQRPPLQACSSFLSVSQLNLTCLFFCTGHIIWSRYDQMIQKVMEDFQVASTRFYANCLLR